MRPRALPFGFSLVLHAAVLLWVASGPVREAVEKRPSLYDMAIRGKEDRIVWYTARSRLPEISPLERRGPSRPPKAEVKAPQTVAATPPRAPRANQLVWLPAPQIRVQAELRSPNLLAFHAPAARPAPPPRPRLFAPPPDRPAAPLPVPTLAPPPELSARLDLAAPLGTAARPQPRAFRPPSRPARLREEPQLALPPEVAAVRNPKLPMPLSGGALKRLPPRDFDPQLVALHRPAGAPVMAAPPQIAAAGPAPIAPGFSATARPQPRAFHLPMAAGRTAAAPVADIAAPDVAVADAPPGSLSMAVVGLHPAERVEAPPPQGSREARFSAGPVPRPAGGEGEPVESARVFVPGLMVRNGPPAASPVLIARAAPTSAETLRDVLRASPPVAAAPLEGRAYAARVSSAPDPMLAGRTVYSMAVQMPNITSYTGSWLIWFAERGERPGAAAGISPPVPLHKVDPKYVASAVADRVEGKVRLAAVIRADGSVGAVVLLAHLDDRLDATAGNALAKWRFEPARRNGTPIEVDAVVEIPFRLAPREAH